MASYPTNIVNFGSPHVNGDVIESAHPNTIQYEVIAIETELGTEPSGPSYDTVAARLDAMDTATSAKLPLAGGTMSGDLNMGTRSITNLKDPSSNSEAATKKYVDDTVESVASDQKLSLATALLFAGI